MELSKAIKLRRSVRHYSTKKVPYQKVAEICDAATYAPMAGNIFSVRLIIVSDKEKIKMLAGASQQHFIAEAKYVIVVYSDTGQLKRSYSDRAERYTRQQAGAAIQNMLLKTTELGLSTCWIGWFNEEMVKRIVFLPDSFQVEALLPIGYAFEKPLQKRKPDLKLIIYLEKYRQDRQKMPKKAL